MTLVTLFPISTPTIATPPRYTPVLGTPKYSVEVRDQYGRLVTVLARPLQKQFSVYRNKPGSCQFVLDLFDPQATLENLVLNQYDIVFRREGTPVFAGQISHIEPTIDGDQKQVSLIATGYFDLLDQRIITADFPGYDELHQNVAFDTVDAGLIAWTLIADTQFPLASDGAVLLQGTSPTLNQSFVAQGTAQLTTLRLLLTNTSATGNLVVGLYTDSNGGPGTLVPNSEQTLAVAGIAAGPAWYTVSYTGTLPALTDGVTYWLKAYLDTAQSGSNGIAWHYLDNDFYPQGHAYSPESPTLFTAGQDLQFFVLLDDNSYQQTKNTYLGIVQANIAASFDLSPTFALYKTVKSSVEDMANTFNGMDFNISVTIDPVTNLMTRYFNVFYPRQGVDNTDLTFIYPGNIKKLDKPRDGKTMLNEVVERGQGSGIDQLTATDAAVDSIQNYGLRQDIEDQADVADTGTLDSLAQEVLRVRKDPLDLPVLTLEGNLKPTIGDYGIGDSIFIQIYEAGLANQLALYRIEQVDAVIDDDDLEEVALTLSAA
jgi:hypothetical protein